MPSVLCIDGFGELGELGELGEYTYNSATTSPFDFNYIQT